MAGSPTGALAVRRIAEAGARAGALACATLLAPAVLAQSAETLEVTVVELDATVTSRDGTPVEGLKAEDFQITLGRTKVRPVNF